MASLEEIQREVNRRRVADALKAQAAQAAPLGRPMPRDVEGRSFFEGAAEREEEFRSTLGDPETIGAVGGAALGTVVGGLPGAMALGAGGARMGRVAGQLFEGEERAMPA